MSIWSYLADGAATGTGYDDIGSDLNDIHPLETWNWDVSTARNYGTNGLIRLTLERDVTTPRAWELAECQFTPTTARALRDALTAAIEYLENLQRPEKE